jgi:transcriptional regulator with XRE-family HTH domain
MSEVKKMDEVLKGIGERVRQARISRHMSQNDLCDKTGLSISFLSNIEMGKQSMNIRALILISDALNVSTDWLLRNNTQSSLEITADEITKQLETCSPQEREVILKLVQTIKDSIQKLKATSDE